MFCYFLIAALIPAMALATNVAPCIGGEPFPTAVRVAGCEIVPCFIVKGEDAIMEMDFTVGGNFFFCIPIFHRNLKFNHFNFKT